MISFFSILVHIFFKFGFYAFPLILEFRIFRGSFCLISDIYLNGIFIFLHFEFYALPSKISSKFTFKNL